jgi:hypothetical protein
MAVGAGRATVAVATAEAATGAVGTAEAATEMAGVETAEAATATVAVETAEAARATVGAARATAVTEGAKVAAEQALCLEARGRGWAVVVWAAQRAAEAPVRVAARAGWVLR